MLNSSITVIVPVTHSLEELRECLETLANLRYPKERFRVALVDCGVVAGLQEFCQDNLSDFVLQASLLVLPEIDHKHPRWLIDARVNEARNHAMRQLPAECFVFTEDDCTFEPDWLDKIAASINKETGAVGGADLLPEDMGWFAEALDYVLNSLLGSGHMRRGDRRMAPDYYPRKQNMAIPGHVLARVGLFNEDKPVSGEIDIVMRIRKHGLHVVYLTDNPVWHRRVTSLANFFFRSAYMASENVLLLRQHHCFRRSSYFLVMLSTIFVIILLSFAFFSAAALTVLITLFGCYLLALLASAFLAGIRSKSIPAGLGVLLVMPAHHASLILGTTRGVLSVSPR